MPDYTVKMTYEKAEEARRLFRDGTEIQDLCDQFKLSHSAMRDIVRGKAWKSKPQKPSKPIKKNKSDHQSARNKWDDVYKLWRHGKTNTEIAQILGVSLSYISLIQWTVKCARKDPAWAEAQKDKKYKKMAEWANSKARSETTLQDWKEVAIQLTKNLDTVRNCIELRALLRLFEQDTVQIYVEGGRDSWEEAPELSTSSPLLESVLTWHIKEADIVESNLRENHYILRLGIYDPEEAEG